MFKRVSSLAAQSAAFAKFVDLLEQTGGERPNLLRVLTYHRVDEPGTRPSLYPGLISATPAAFAQQMEYLAYNWRVISVAELLEAQQKGKLLPPRSVMVTFDDACRDFAEHAWPTLRRYKLPVALFVPTAFPDQPQRVFWWDRLYHALDSTARRDALSTPVGQLPLSTAAERMEAFKQLRDYVKTRPHREAMAWVEEICGELGAEPAEHNVLGWEALRQLAREGVTLGAHTRTHPLVNRISIDEVRDEALGSLEDLRREVGQVPPIFAYPSGGFNDDVVRALGRAGFALAFTTAVGLNDLGRAHRLLLRRVNVGQRTNLAVLRARLLPWAVHLNRLEPLAGA